MLATAAATHPCPVMNASPDSSDVSRARLPFPECISCAALPLLPGWGSSGALPGAPSSAPFLRPHSLKAWLACHHAWSWSVLPFELGQEHWDVDFCMQGAGMDLSLSLIDS